MDSLLLALTALLVAAPNLGEPGVLIFDERFYVGDAVSHLDVGVGLGFQAHPPLGTWLFAAGLATLGRSPAAWRTVPLLLGVVTVVLLHRISLRVLPEGPLRRPLAAGAALLLVLDGSWYVLSRTAMLDGPLTTLVLATVAAALVAADHGGRHGRRWLGIMGALAGAAAAVKWSGALGLVLAGSVWALRRRQQGELARPRPADLLSVIIAAALAYSLAWVPYAAHRGEVPMASCPPAAAPCVAGGGITGVVAQHRALVDYHTSVRFTGGYDSDPSLWPISYRPVTLYRSSCDVPTRPAEDPFSDTGSCPPDAVPGEDPMTYVGNAAVWLLFVILLPFLVAAAAMGSLAARVTIAGWALQWLPWLAATRSSFLYYMAPAVPFMALGIVVAVGHIPRIRPSHTMISGLAGGSIGGALSLLPAVPLGLAILGWATGGVVAGRTDAAVHDSHPRVQVGLVAGTVVFAATIFVLMLPTWTASG